ncbi:MAG: site-specific integrase [Oscillospiraceae bacterium]|nr:site-specific integrase [Oscillospiraceae bacterium]
MTVQPIRDTQIISQIKSLLQHKADKYYIMFVIGLNTGLRISDILNLTVADVRDRTHVSITEQKTGKRKRFLINEQLKSEIDRYLNDNSLLDTDFIIQSRKGENRPISRIQAYRVLNDVAREIGLTEIGTHTMRKTFGYWHYQQYKDVVILQDIFNHSAPSVTLRYIGINDDMKDDTLRGFFI